MRQASARRRAVIRGHAPRVRPPCRGRECPGARGFGLRPATAGPAPPADPGRSSACAPAARATPSCLARPSPCRRTAPRRDPAARDRARCGRWSTCPSRTRRRGPVFRLWGSSETRHRPREPLCCGQTSRSASRSCARSRTPRQAARSFGGDPEQRAARSFSTDAGNHAIVRDRREARHGKSARLGRQRATRREGAAAWHVRGIGNGPRNGR
ncbi:hypothetical protein ACVMGC_011431 [Bradyrhizobium barranii subsp. barranii]